MCDIYGLELPLEPPLSMVVWETPRLKPDDCEALGSGETHGLGNPKDLGSRDTMGSF